MNCFFFFNKFFIFFIVVYKRHIILWCVRTARMRNVKCFCLRLFGVLFSVCCRYRASIVRRSLELLTEFTRSVFFFFIAFLLVRYCSYITRYSFPCVFFFSFSSLDDWTSDGAAMKCNQGVSFLFSLRHTIQCWLFGLETKVCFKDQPFFLFELAEWEGEGSSFPSATCCVNALIDLLCFTDFIACSYAFCAWMQLGSCFACLLYMPSDGFCK